MLKKWYIIQWFSYSDTKLIPFTHQHSQLSKLISILFLKIMKNVRRINLTATFTYLHELVNYSSAGLSLLYARDLSPDYFRTQCNQNM